MLFVGFYELTDVLIVLDEVLCLEVSNLARQLKFNPEIRDDHPVMSHPTASLWFRSMDLKKCGCGREAVGIDGIPLNARERQMAFSDPKA